ncbi:MAG: 3-keto-L-gulonate-6-phosphate decarboxylase [Chloroflexi bacterium]|nr:MAG: 3-keto-L-gulonate-6-phosphate decarboxylase [Chloroflexota bacterium]MBL1195491.1 3-keto-L-gulonate-6-phosphate decarboxylase [Chloroflexota bacterium]NOH12773.1 3-keto-L-gulonate-6-phosphate decarboxylase [Chloroflexota bacterium]
MHSLKQPPLLQLALDYIELPPALAMTQLVKDEVEVIEIGTPLTKASGMLSVSTVRELCPDKLVLADVKSPDCGGLEAKMCFDSGADWMTVLGAAPLDTVKLAVEEAQGRPDKEMFIELTGIKDILASATAWRDLGVERMVYHRGWDEGNASRSWDDRDLEVIGKLIDMGFQVSVAGGIELEKLSFFQDLDISVFIIGRSIYAASDPIDAARQFRAKINELWGSRVSAEHQLDAVA